MSISILILLPFASALLCYCMLPVFTPTVRYIVVVSCVVGSSSYVMGWFTVMDPVVEACITSFVNDPTEQQYMALLCNS